MKARWLLGAAWLTACGGGPAFAGATLPDGGIEAAAESGAEAVAPDATNEATVDGGTAEASSTVDAVAVDSAVTVVDAHAPDAAETCAPTTCDSLGYNCGPAEDGCGHAINCGSCPTWQSCGDGGFGHVCEGPDAAPIPPMCSRFSPNDTACYGYNSDTPHGYQCPAEGGVALAQPPGKCVSIPGLGQAYWCCP